MIIGFTGPMSSGKTLCMTAYAYRDWKNGNRLLSNYNLTFPEKSFTFEPVTKEMVREYAAEKVVLDQSTVLLDEIYLWIDSRLSMKKDNRIFSYFALQTAKRNVNLYYTAQNFHSVDRRIRDNTHVIINCVPLVLEDGQFFKIKDQWNRGIPKRWYDKFYILAVEMRREQRGFDIIPSIDRSIIKASDYFDFYDTKEIIEID